MSIYYKDSDQRSGSSRFVGPDEPGSYKIWTRSEECAALLRIRHLGNPSKPQVAEFPEAGDCRQGCRRGHTFAALANSGYCRSTPPSWLSPPELGSTSRCH